MCGVCHDDTAVFEQRIGGSMSYILEGSEYANIVSGCKFHGGGTMCRSIMCRVGYGEAVVLSSTLRLARQQWSVVWMTQQCVTFDLVSSGALKV